MVLTHFFRPLQLQLYTGQLHTGLGSNILFPWPPKFKCTIFNQIQTQIHSYLCTILIYWPLARCDMAFIEPMHCNKPNTCTCITDFWPEYIIVDGKRLAYFWTEFETNAVFWPVSYRSFHIVEQLFVGCVSRQYVRNIQTYIPVHDQDLKLTGQNFALTQWPLGDLTAVSN